VPVVFIFQACALQTVSRLLLRMGKRDGEMPEVHFSLFKKDFIQRYKGPGIFPKEMNKFSNALENFQRK
jgi:hypothetical protein